MDINAGEIRKLGTLMVWNSRVEPQACVSRSSEKTTEVPSMMFQQPRICGGICLEAIFTSMMY
jgi:hypothetical protein